MSYLDAYFGRVYANGVSVELGAGVNYAGGLTVGTSGAGTTRRVDVAVSDAIQALTPLASVLRISGVGILEGTGSTVLSDAAYTVIAGAYTGSAKSDAVLTPSTTLAQFAYSGTAGRVLVIASGTVHCIDDNVAVMSLFVNAASAGGALTLYFTGGTNSSFCTCGLVVVAPGDVISLRAITDVNDEDLDTPDLSMIAVAIQDAIT